MSTLLLQSFVLEVVLIILDRVLLKYGIMRYYIRIQKTLQSICILLIELMIYSYFIVVMLDVKTRTFQFTVTFYFKREKYNVLIYQR